MAFGGKRGAVMSISVQCPGCEKKLRTKDELAGKRLKCPGCGHVIVVPSAQPASVPLPKNPAQGKPPAPKKPPPDPPPSSSKPDPMRPTPLAGERTPSATKDGLQRSSEINTSDMRLGFGLVMVVCGGIGVFFAGLELKYIYYLILIWIPMIATGGYLCWKSFLTDQQRRNTRKEQRRKSEKELMDLRRAQNEKQAALAQKKAAPEVPLPALERLKSEDPDTREKAVEELTRSPNPAAVQTLLDMLRDSAWHVRFGAAKTLGMMKEKSAVDFLIELLGDGDISVRSQAASSLGMIGDARAVESLITALKAPDESVREEAALALGKMRDPRAVEPLLVLLASKEGYGDAAEAAAQALGQIGDRRAFEPLKAVLTRRQFSYLRMHSAILALGSFRDPSVVDIIGGFLMESSYETAVRALAMIESPRAIELLGEFILERDKRERHASLSAAIEELGKIGNAQAVALLVKALQAETAQGYSSGAVVALGKTRNVAAAEPLLNQAANADHAADAIEALEEVLSQAASGVAENVLDAAASLKNVVQPPEWRMEHTASRGNAPGRLLQGAPAGTPRTGPTKEVAFPRPSPASTLGVGVAA